MPTRNLTIMFTDIKGFTERTSRETRHGIVSFIETHNNLLLPVIRHYGGTVVKTIGDAFLVHFDSPTDGVLCGLTIQEVLRQYNAKAAAPDERVNVRVAINVGDVELKDSDVLGEPVNVAARLEGITEAGDVYFTEAVYLAMNRKEVPSTEIGERTFAGISVPIRIYKVIQDQSSEQNRKIAQAVQWSNGLPVLSSKAVSAPAVAGGIGSIAAPKFSALLMIPGLVIAGMLVLVFIFFQYSSAPPRPRGPLPAPAAAANTPVQQAQKLFSAGEALSAFETADKHLLEQPDDAEAREVALKAARQHLDALITRDGNDVALAWIKPLAERRQYLQTGLGAKFSTLDAEVTTLAALKKHRTSSAYYEEIHKLLKKYHGDAEVPYTIGVVMKRSIMPEVLLWIFKESITRGHKPDAVMFECIATTLQRNRPGSDYCKEAREFAETSFVKESEQWALAVLDKNPGKIPDDVNDYSVINAFLILRARQHNSANDNFYQRLQCVITVADPSGEVQQALLDSADPKKTRQAILLLQSIVNDSDNTQEIRDRLRPILTKLKQKDGGF